ncbi:hypothetical protein CY35_08G064700 [Sphagnum magellanicum]|nr:hypothetical protein CY35_08G064700 [Sphagnum magellanicum]
MAQKKKIKINNRPRQKEKKVVDIANLNEQLDLLGLKVRSVTADGNCFFRAIADQLDGQEEQHATYRQSVVDYVQEHREEFEPFVEDEVPFEEYCSTMREDGTWAGNMELQATSLVTGCNICIHQLKTPRWHIRNFESADACTLHLSYHDGEHYNSVRRLDDDGGGRAKPITIEVDARPSTKPPPAKDKMNHGHQIVKIVMDGTGCKSVDRVQEVLHDVHGDTDAAIEFLIAEQASGGDVSPACSCERIPHSPEGSGETHHNRSCRIHCDDPEPSTSQDSCLVTKTEERSASHAAGQTNSTTLPLQGAARNKACPCGSKRKYKSCCGTQHPKPTITSISRSDEVQSNRLRKQRLKLAKDHTSEPVHSDVPRTVDMGALCI